MTGDIDRYAEVLRLARVLGVDPGDLAFLHDAPAAELRALRNAVSDRLLERSRRAFERAVALADHLPGGLAARLAEHAMGPVLSGRAAALLTPEKAADLAHRLPPHFLSQVAEHIDLRKVGPLIHGISAQAMAAAGAELRARGEWMVLGAFVGHVDDAKLRELLEDFDGEALLRAGFVVEQRDRLDSVVALLGDHRLDELLQAADEHGLWTEAIALASHLAPDQQGRILAAVERLGQDRQDRLAAQLRDDDELLAAAAPLLEAAPARLRARVLPG
ncbi:MAG TPA: hypothetical protein VD931_03215 [Baekduia sp.]|nr:hypothetical protein [Baekduia sp.]